MRYPNLAWAIEDEGSPRYEFARRIGCTEARFSRCMNGRLDFSDGEKSRIADFLGYPLTWLFAEPAPPDRKTAGEFAQSTA